MAGNMRSLIGSLISGIERVCEDAVWLRQHPLPGNHPGLVITPGYWNGLGSAATVTGGGWSRCRPFHVISSIHSDGGGWSQCRSSHVISSIHSDGGGWSQCRSSDVISSIRTDARACSRLRSRRSLRRASALAVALEFDPTTWW